MNLKLLSLALAAVTVGSMNAAIQWPTVDIRNNKVDIVEDQIKICKFDEEKGQVVCISKDGEPFYYEVETEEVSSTGTPPWLQFHNYLGQSEGSAGNGFGSGRRVIYLKK